VFGIELGEMFTLGVVALLVFGPERLPEVAVKAAHFVRKMRSAADSARSELSTSFGTDLDDLRELDPRTFVRKHVLDPVNEDGVLNELRANGKSIVAGSRTPAVSAKNSLAKTSGKTSPAKPASDEAVGGGTASGSTGDAASTAKAGSAGSPGKAVSVGGPTPLPTSDNGASAAPSSVGRTAAKGVGPALPAAMAPSPLAVGERPPFDVEAT